jgi:transcriptional regulator with XRE-family HTH domain
VQHPGRVPLPAAASTRTRGNARRLSFGRVEPEDTARRLVDAVQQQTAALSRQHLLSLGEFIKAQRHLNKMSQRELARLSDLSDTYMSQIERGRHEPSLSVLRALAESLGIRPDQLILYAAGLPLPDEPTSTEDAIRGDSRLTGEQRTALLAVLRSYIEANDQPT